MELEKGSVSTHPDAITGSRYNVYSPQFLSPYHHLSFSLQRPTVYPRSRRLQQRPSVLRLDAPTFYLRQRTHESYTLAQPHRTRELMIIQGIINFKQVEVLLDTGSSVNIIPKNMISQINGHHNVEYIKTQITTVNGQIKVSEAITLQLKIGEIIKDIKFLIVNVELKYLMISNKLYECF
ncbi:hypothetical protein TNCV_283641 [Trichonephila clavipes]|uniref:Peptidase A2 domain-containing protein n=1 Tax=Trichonephila clavipes TaxID=2585209 RepID=A0A8X6SPV6_TRICX|nr:hypothetical protein TNCV_283641 [Trichonephila clavipes]